MTKLKNIASGPRGLRTADGLLMVEAGETVDVELAKGEVPSKEWFAAPGSKAAQDADEAPADTGDLDALKEQVATLTKQVEDLTKERDEGATKLAEAEKANATLTKQVEDLTKPAPQKT